MIVHQPSNYKYSEIVTMGSVDVLFKFVEQFNFLHHFSHNTVLGIWPSTFSQKQTDIMAKVMSSGELMDVNVYGFNSILTWNL